MSLCLPASPVAKAAQPPPSPHHDKLRSHASRRKGCSTDQAAVFSPSDRRPDPLPPRAPPAATAHRGLSLLTLSAGGKRAWRAWLSTSRDERADTAYTCTMYTWRQMWYRLVPCFPLSPVRQRLSRQSDSIAVWATIVTLPHAPSRRLASAHASPMQGSYTHTAPCGSTTTEAIPETRTGK